MKTEGSIRALALPAHGLHLVVVIVLAFGISAAAQNTLSLHSATKSSETFSFAFRAAQDAPYDVEYRDGLHNGTWKKFRSVLAGPSREVTISDNAAVTPSRFYRVASRDSAIYSVNAVGYINVYCTPQRNLIANQLFNDGNRLTLIAPAAPDYTVVWKPGRLGMECAKFYNGSWRDCATGRESEMTLHPGQGAVLVTQAEFVITFVGQLIEGALTNSLPAGLSLCSSIVPQSGLLSSVLEFSPSPGDMIYRLDKPSGTYHSFTFSDEGWSPMEPAIAVGESFWVELAEAKDWVRQFEVLWGNGWYWVTNFPYGGSPASAPGRTAPFIVSNPRSQVAAPGSEVNLNVEASGSPRLRYQWRFENTELAYATNATLRLENVRPAERGTYSVMVSNTFGCVTSSVARILVETRPTLQLQVAGNALTLCWPESALNYIVEESDDLGSGWAEVSTAATLDNGTLCITVPVPSSARYYRLRASETLED